MYAFKIKPGSAEFLKQMIDLEDIQLDRDVQYYVLVDLDETVIKSESELRALEEAEGESFIIFE